MRQDKKGCCAQNTNNTQKNKCGRGAVESQRESKHEIVRNSSMCNLIKWNISKALDKNPYIDLRISIRRAQEKMKGACDRGATDAVISDLPEEQHLQCALLAWQQLGHKSAESLYKFLDQQRIEERKTNDNTSYRASCGSAHSANSAKSRCCDESTSFGSAQGPVVKLPNVVLRFQNTPTESFYCNKTTKPAKKVNSDIKSKIDAACCLDSECAQRLAQMDTATAELSQRARSLAKREADRVELLERAETAWKDLERGFQRRLCLSEEKEDELKMQIEKMIEDRNNYKSVCMTLTDQLKALSALAEQEKSKLNALEKEVCERGCNKLRLSGECARAEGTLVEQQCKAGHFERDLQFKEEQARRKLSLLEKDLESTRAIALAAERAMQAETGALRDQHTEVSNQLAAAEKETTLIKSELENLRKDKLAILKQLDGCKQKCDLKQKDKVEKLQKLKEQLEEAKDKMLECRCKLPVDATVEVKRTPSLAAVCGCAPEDRLLESCSCSSLRTSLLSNLLSDLFGGLQAELGNTGATMPCQLLKCLEDKHNWDRASQAKTNLKDFFSRLLLGELDIAIATSLEKYHAKWVGASCADSKLTPRPGDDTDPGWEQRAIERRAQKMAAQLAEQLYQQRAEQLTQRAKEIVKNGPPPCKCKPSTNCSNQDAVFSLMINSKTPYNSTKTVNSEVNKQQCLSNKPSHWNQTVLDVTQIKYQIEELKKDLIKKEDFKSIENKIEDILKQSAVTKHEITRDTKKNLKLPEESPDRELADNVYDKFVSNEHEIKPRSPNKKKCADSNKTYKKSIQQEKSTKQFVKPNNRQTYAVNLCLCNSKKYDTLPQSSKINDKGKNLVKQKPLKNLITPSPSLKQTKPINMPILDRVEAQQFKKIAPPCDSNKNCFHKIPSNKSIDRLLETLTKWKCDLSDSPEKYLKHTKSILATTDYKNQVTDTVFITTPAPILEDKCAGNEIDLDIGDNNKGDDLKKPDLTESLYITAINLERSNENMCKCKHKVEIDKIAKSRHKTTKNVVKPHIKTRILPIKSLKHNIYKDKNIEKASQTEDLNNKQGVKNSPKYINSKTNDLETPNYTDTRKQIQDDTNINKILNESASCVNKRDYCIKFLGVTLTDISSQKLRENSMTDDRYQIPTKENVEENYSEIKQKVSIMKSVGKNTSVSNGDRADNAKCECNAKLEEFKDFINTFLTKHVSTRLNDKAIDLQSFNNSNDSVGKCTCCDKLNIDSSKELETNALHLLEDHLKGKLEEFKTFSCRASCISQEDEKKIFAIILKRVKQVISDCANEVKCSCAGSLSRDGSWKRAYGLLQEYLKIKIKRVQCLCEFKDNKNIVMPHILDKVCNLIENDFQRLKNICKCSNRDDISCKLLHNLESIQDQYWIKDLPEKDTDSLDQKYFSHDIKNKSIVKTLTKIKSIEAFYTHNIFTQITPNLDMKTESCDAMDFSKFEQTTETDVVLTKNKSLGLILVNTECNCDYDDKLQRQGHLWQSLELKEVFVDNIADIQKNNEILQTQSLHRIRNSKECTCNKSKVSPYIGCTVTCSCEPRLGSCVCTKSLVQGNSDKIYKIWKGLALVNSDGPKDVSYIMENVENKKKLPTIDNYAKEIYNNRLDNIVQSSSDPKITHEMKTDFGDGVATILKTTDELSMLEPTQNSYVESPSLETVYSQSEDQLDWLEEIRPSVRASTIQLTNSIFFPGIHGSDELKVDEMNDDTESSLTFEKCSCDKVPVCHVKMLVENIENNLLEFRCTCDSLISKVCPVHSKRR